MKSLRVVTKVQNSPRRSTKLTCPKSLRPPTCPGRAASGADPKRADKQQHTGRRFRYSTTGLRTAARCIAEPRAPGVVIFGRHRSRRNARHFVLDRSAVLPQDVI